MTFIESIVPEVAAPEVAGRAAATTPSSAAPVAASIATGPAIEIAPTDPLFAYLQAASGVVDAERLELDSAALGELRAAGVRVIVPLVTQGELIGALYLGPRLSDQDYSTDDRKLLSTLAAQAAPAIRVAQLVREQAVEIQARERLEQEMRVATLIQQQFLPRELPQLPEWQVAAYYGPARAVGGDFYDFIALPDGRIGIVVGDVTDKGVPAALIMARTQSVLRGEAPRQLSPAKVLERANEILLPEMPARMFVTCLYMILEPETGRVVFANAGHNLPYVRTADGVVELRATGMPLGLLPGMDYPEHEAVLAPGESVLLYSDGLVEAHDRAGDMFGFPRLRELMATELPSSELLDHLLDELHGFVGRGWDQEDDITLVALQRTGGGAASLAQAEEDQAGPLSGEDVEGTGGRVLLNIALPGASGNERLAMDRVAEAVAGLGIASARLEQLKTAVSEAAMNAIEYGSQNDPTIPIAVEAVVEADDLVVRITDRGLGGPLGDAEEPDIEKKLAGEQKPRGWGLFLIKHMVDAMEITTHGTGQTVTLTLHLKGVDDASRPVQG
jgi:serine phosphatase RsbU (regulator of sigma subunit)/anti-sigma regulatory factor (Ser/Thr protein kinase)